jgi:hypothetical protein
MDRDMKAADEYVRRLDQAGRISDLCGRSGDGDVLRAMLREAYMQGWHGAMVACDEDDVNGVCQECGGTKHTPICSQR